MLTEYDRNDQIHVGNFQERHFLEIKESNAKNHTGLGWGGALGYRGGYWGIEGQLIQGVGEIMPP